MSIFNDNVFLVNKACISVGKMLDHAVYSLHQNADTFFALFITSGLAAKLQKADINIISGNSGIELSYEVMKRCGISYERTTPRHTTGLSKEFYAAHALAHIQYDTGISYNELIHIISVSDIIRLYDSYHSRAVSLLPWQMSDSDRAEAIEEIKSGFTDELRSAFEAAGINSLHIKKETHLKEMRLRNGLSQSRLAAASGIPVRTIQQYEQRRKDINKASADSIIRLAYVLNCEPSSLLEHH